MLPRRVDAPQRPGESAELSDMESEAGSEAGSQAGSDIGSLPSADEGISSDGFVSVEESSDGRAADDEDEEDDPLHDSVRTKQRHHLYQIDKSKLKNFR